MRRIMPISLPEKLFEEVKESSRKQGVSVSEIAREAIELYLFKQKIEKIRKNTISDLTKRKKFLSEEEIFKKIS